MKKNQEQPGSKQNLLVPIKKKSLVKLRNTLKNGQQIDTLTRNGNLKNRKNCVLR